MVKQTIKINTSKLILQPIEDDSEFNDGASDGIFDLKDQMDEAGLVRFWDSVEQDLHNDPGWYEFST